MVRRPPFGFYLPLSWSIRRIMSLVRRHSPSLHSSLRNSCLAQRTQGSAFWTPVSGFTIFDFEKRQLVRRGLADHMNSSRSWPFWELARHTFLGPTDANFAKSLKNICQDWCQSRNISRYNWHTPPLLLLGRIKNWNK